MIKMSTFSLEVVGCSAASSSRIGDIAMTTGMGPPGVGADPAALHIPTASRQYLHILQPYLPHVSTVFSLFNVYKDAYLSDTPKSLITRHGCRIILLETEFQENLSRTREAAGPAGIGKKEEAEVTVTSI